MAGSSYGSSNQLPLTDDRAARNSATSELSRWRDQIVAFIHGMCGLTAMNGQEHQPGTDLDNPLYSAVQAWPFWRKRNELHLAALRGNWRRVKTILDTLGNTDMQVLEVHYEIAVFSVEAGKRTINFVEQLLRYLPYKSLANTNGDGVTVLHAAAAANNKAAAIILVERIPHLIYAVDRNGDYPIHRAARFGSRQVLKYLMSVTHWEGDGVSRPIPAADGQMLLFLNVIEARLFDIALDLIDEYPWGAITKVGQQNRTALLLLSQMPSIFWFRWSCCLWELFLFIFPQMKSISNGKYLTMRLQANKLLRRVCEEMKTSSEGDPRDIYEDAILKAATTGNFAVVWEILKTFPSAISCQEPTTCLTILDLAIQNRCLGVLYLIYQTGGYRHLNLEKQDSAGDNILHKAAKLPVPDRDNYLFRSAALHMQMEIQCYKAVQKIVCRPGLIQENRNGETPHKVFIKEHMKLKEAGEKWMKDTANSCCIVAVLIITVMFAAAITVPGGNNSKGYPNFSGDLAFQLFAIADAISVFSSTFSLVMFVLTLIRTYDVDSFLYFNTAVLVLGLVGLYISIASLVVAFSITYFLVLGRKTAGFLVPASALAAYLALAAFGCSQFPHLVGFIIFSTFNRSWVKKLAKSLY